MMKDSRSAFTLIELLVVVAIIAMLISILLPSLSRAREAAKSVACLSQQRQHATAAMMYANDHSQLMPGSNNPAYRHYKSINGPFSETLNAGILIDQDHHGWGNSNYLGTPDMMFCPSLTIYPEREKGRFAEAASDPRPVWSGYNWLYIRKDHDSWGEIAANNTASVPGSRSLNFDLAGWNVWASYVDPWKAASLNPAHKDRMNVLYMDGHAEPKSLKEVNLKRSWTSLLAYLNSEAVN